MHVVENNCFWTTISSAQNFTCRSRPIIAIPIDESPNVATDGIIPSYFPPRARRDRARSEALFRHTSPITSSVACLTTTGTSKSLCFSNEAEMTIPSTSRYYKTLSAANTTDRTISNNLHQSIVNGSSNSFLGTNSPAGGTCLFPLGVQ